MMCACGCGLETKVVDGQPNKFIHNHHGRTVMHPRHGKAFILSRIETIPESGCWVWSGRLTTPGYATYYLEGQYMNIHRYAYELWKGPIPEGLTIDHLCRVRCCVNPDHLEAVSHRENLLRGESPSARNHQKTHCFRGHLFDDVNTRFNKRGSRDCRQCDRDDHNRAYKLKNERATTC